MDWSYALTSSEERTLWERLSIFPGSCDLSAIEGVCGDKRLPSEEVFDALDGLVSSLERLHDLDELHLVHRVEEVHPGDT